MTGSKDVLLLRCDTSASAFGSTNEFDVTGQHEKETDQGKIEEGTFATHFISMGICEIASMSTKPPRDLTPLHTADGVLRKIAPNGEGPQRVETAMHTGD